MPEVKKFIFEDLPLYYPAEFKSVPGAVPELYLRDADGENVEVIDLSKMTRDELNALMLEKGFYKKKHKEDAAPIEYRDGPIPPPKTEEEAEEPAPEAVPHEDL